MYYFITDVKKMILEKGRPENLNERLPKEVRTYELLDLLGIEYQRVDHEPAMTMEACKAIDDTLETVMCKNLFLTNRQQTSFYLLMMPADKPFKTKDLSAQINSARLSFGSGELMEKLLDITPGSLSFLGLVNDKENEVSLLIDEDLLVSEKIGVHPCINTSSLALYTKDITEKIIPALNHTPTFVKL